MALVAGVDSSTQATKVLVVDADDGSVVASGRAPHGVAGEAGARETHPDDWWQALAAALRGTRRAGEVAAIAVAGQQHGLVALDAAGRPLRPAMLWNDTRAAPDAAALVRALGADRWAELMGAVPVASFTVAKWAWLRRLEPQVAAAARAVHLPHDHLNLRLTGQAATDRGDASGTCWWSTATGRYAQQVLELPAVRLDPDLLPPVLGPSDRAGEVSAAAAAELGLPAGAAVAPGSGDNMGAALGLGAGPGAPVLSLGTSGTAFAVSEARPADPTGIVAGFADAAGRFLPLACTLNATLAIDRLAGWLGLDREAVEPGGEVVVLPWLDGERTPNLPHAAGSIEGLRHDTTPGQILRAAYEGAVAGLLDALDAIDAAGSGLDPHAPLMLVGGGAQGAAWRETVRRLGGRPVLVPRATELVALGAAVQAAAVLAGEQPADVARHWDTSAGELLDPLERDTAALERVAAARERAVREAAGS
jgi:xylulokinase